MLYVAVSLRPDHNPPHVYQYVGCRTSVSMAGVCIGNCALCIAKFSTRWRGYYCCKLTRNWSWTHCQHKVCRFAGNAGGGFVIYWYSQAEGVCTAIIADGFAAALYKLPLQHIITKRAVVIAVCNVAISKIPYPVNDGAIRHGTDVTLISHLRKYFIKAVGIWFITDHYRYTVSGVLHAVIVGHSDVLNNISAGCCVYMVKGIPALLVV